MITTNRPLVIGIGGGTGSGKTCVSEALRLLLERNGPVSILDQDSYYRDLAHLSALERHKVNFDDPAALDHDLLLAHLRDLIGGKAVRKPRYCFASHTRLATFDMVSPASTLIVEGIFALFDPRARSLMDYKLFVDVAADLRFIRRLRRDLEDRGRTADSVMTQYLTSVRPMHDLYIEPTKAFADIVLKNEGPIEQLVAVVQNCLAAQSARQNRPDRPENYPFFPDRCDRQTGLTRLANLEGRP
jgi:uridine kinase